MYTQDLNDMVFFAEVVERGGFAAAGRALGIPKSRLSRRISELEARLGVRLLQRTTRRLSLTDAGDTYLRYCQSVRESAQSAQAAIEQTQSEPAGLLRVSCSVSVAQGLVGKLMPAFLNRHPKVRIELVVSNRLVNLVEEGIDVALRARVAMDDSGSLVIKRFGVTRLLLVASPELLIAHGTPRVPKDLEAMPSASLLSADGRSVLHLYGPGGEDESVSLQPRYVADDLTALKYAALGGIGTCWLPDYMVREELQDGRLVHILKDWGLPRAIFHAAFASRRNMSPALRAFLDYLGETIPDQWPVPGDD
ncbi:MAG: LysR substrate-binding domain-containing protein [Comamonas sp.]